MLLNLIDVYYVMLLYLYVGNGNVGYNSTASPVFVFNNLGKFCIKKYTYLIHV